MSQPLTSMAFVSASQTGTGSSQSVAHDLGVIPGVIMVIVDDSSTATYILGTSTSQNVVLTVTNAKTFKIVAFPPSPVNGR